MENQTLRQITQEELQEILENHKLWLETSFNKKKKGKRADLRDAYLNSVKLRGADLRGASLDFSCFPLWCGSLDVHIDDKQAIQLLYHLVRNVQYSKNTSEELKALLLQPLIIDKANQFHRVEECGKIELKEEEEQ